MIETTHTETVSEPVKHLELVTSHGIIRCPSASFAIRGRSFPRASGMTTTASSTALPGGGAICA